MEDQTTIQEFELVPESELRFEVEGKDEKVTLELINGLAEIFGTELVKKKKYEFTCGAKIAVFSWQGCTLKLVGKTESSYTAKDTPMNMYLNCHAVLEGMRKTAAAESSKGPIVMVVGPSDVGKSSLSKLLLNYAVRMGKRPIYVDLDVDQGHIAVPGTVGALLVERPAHVTDGFSKHAPMIFHYGRKSPTNPDLYNHIVTRLAKVCSERMRVDKRAEASGLIINTPGWAKGAGYEMLVEAANALEVDTIFVLDQERLYNQLVRDMPGFVNVVILPKSGGVVAKSATQRTEAREQSIREYFYGSRTPLYPHSIEVKWSETKIYKIGAPSLPSSCMPLGMRVEDSLKKLVAVTPGPNLLHHVLSVSFAENPDDNVAQRNVAGFVCVTNVDVVHQTFKILSPQPGPLPKNILLLSEIQFMDTH